MNNIPNYRIGNDMTIFWAIHEREGAPYNLDGKKVRLYVTNERGREEVEVKLTRLNDGTTNNVIRWDFKGESQRVLGKYTLTVSILNSVNHKEIMKDYCEAFNLVSRSEMEEEEGDANISIGGDLILASKLDIYRFDIGGVDIADIYVEIGNLQALINGLEAEIKLKASVSSVEQLGDLYKKINKSVADLTIRANELEAEIKLKASAESVTEIKNSLGAIRSSLAELVIRANDLEAEIKLKASRTEITTLEGSILQVGEAVAQQIIKVDGLEASIENLVSKEVFNAVTGGIERAYSTVKQTVEGIETTIRDQGGEIASIKESIDGVSVSVGTVREDLDSLRNQIDGVTESYFYPYTPTLENEPAATWIAEGSELEHKGDTFTNTAEIDADAGKSWRWLKSESGEWGWIVISDTDAIRALQMAAKAQETADGKCTTFYVQPSNYGFGDIWFVHNDNYPPYKKGEILCANQSSAIFSLSHWEQKTSYTDAINDLDETMRGSFRDGVLDDAERKAIAENLKSLAKEKSAVDTRYNILIVNADFADGELKDEYREKKLSYDRAYSDLLSVVNEILEAETEELKSLFETYETKSEAYDVALDTYNEFEERVKEALMGSMNYAHIYIDNITNDGVLTPIEKEQLFEIYRSIAREYDTTVGSAYNYKIWKYMDDGITETIGNNGIDGRYEAYLAYKIAYAPILNAFTSSYWGFDNMAETTELDESLSVSKLKEYFEAYYVAYEALWKIFSSITAAIEDAQKKAEDTLKALTENLTPEEMVTLIGKGVVLSTVIATKDKDGKVTAGMNASDMFSHPEHGRVVFAGGVKDLEDWNNATGILYEDGHFVIKSAEINDEIKIGNATLKNIVQLASQFDVVSVPYYNEETDSISFLPLFTVNRNEAGQVISISSLYSIQVQGSLAAEGSVAAKGLAQEGSGEEGEGGTTTGEYKMYKHVQSIPSDEWIIRHGLGKYPNVKIVDTMKQLCFGDIIYESEDVVVVKFGAAESGVAYLD